MDALSEEFCNNPLLILDLEKFNLLIITVTSLFDRKWLQQFREYSMWLDGKKKGGMPKQILTWVKNQRQRKKEQQLSMWKIKMLDSIKFEWFVNQSLNKNLRDLAYIINTGGRITPRLQHVQKRIARQMSENQPVRNGGKGGRQIFSKRSMDKFKNYSTDLRFVDQPQSQKQKCSNDLSPEMYKFKNYSTDLRFVDQPQSQKQKCSNDLSPEMLAKGRCSDEEHTGDAEDEHARKEQVAPQTKEKGSLSSDKEHTGSAEDEHARKEQVAPQTKEEGSRSSDKEHTGNAEDEHARKEQFEEGIKVVKKKSQPTPDVVNVDSDDEGSKAKEKTSPPLSSSSHSKHKVESTTTNIILMYPFVGGMRIEDAAKDLKVLSHDEKILSEQEILKLQQEASIGRSHIITITVEDRDRLNKPEFLNDTLVDFWMRWYACNCCLCQIIFSAFIKLIDAFLVLSFFHYKDLSEGSAVKVLRSFFYILLLYNS